MRIRCIENAYKSLPSTSVYQYSPEYGDAKFSLQIGEDYIVYAIWSRGSEILYSILDSEYSRYPIWLPSTLFEVIDGRLSSCWQYAAHSGYTANAH